MRRSLGGIVRKNHRVIGLVATIIVLATFIVKEGLRDRVKDLADAINSAETSYEIRDDFGRVGTRLQMIFSSLREVEKKLPTKGAVEPSFVVNISDTVIEISQTLQNCEASLDNTSRLMAKIKESQETSNHVVELRSEIIKARDQSADMVKRSLDGGGRGSRFLHPEILLPTDKDIITGTTVLMGESLRFFEESDSIAKRVLNDAAREKARAEHFFKLWNWCAYCLYAFGTGLALLAKIYGVGDGSVGE